MKTLSIIFLAITCIYSSPETKDLWEKFKKNHNKVYNSLQEDQDRHTVFLANLRKIESHNVKYEKGEETYYMGITPFADLTHEEFLERIRTPIVQHNVSEEILTFDNNIREPFAVDWRTKEGVVSEVPNEGRCKASWAFSAIGAMESHAFLQTGESIKLSAQELVDCVSLGDYNSGCDGGDTTKAFDYTLNKGLLSESDYVWRGEANSICADYYENKTFKIKTYKKVYDGIPATEAAVAYVGPMSAVVDATSMQFYAGGIFYTTDCLHDDHITQGVLIVGYNSDINLNYWIVRFSWGPLWGEDGYMRLTKWTHYDCGLTTNVLYPIIE